MLQISKTYNDRNKELFIHMLNVIEHNARLSNNVVFNASNLRPDTIMKYNGEYYIIDAKYYGKDNNEVQRLPDTSDNNKQITYGKYFEEISGNEPYSVFLIPSGDKESIEFIGYADLSEVLKSKSKKYARISTLLVNTRFLMNLKFNKASDKLKKYLLKKLIK